MQVRVFIKPGLDVANRGRLAEYLMSSLPEGTRQVGGGTLLAQGGEGTVSDFELEVPSVEEATDLLALCTRRLARVPFSLPTVIDVRVDDLAQEIRLEPRNAWPDDGG